MDRETILNWLATFEKEDGYTKKDILTILRKELRQELRQEPKDTNKPIERFTI